MVGITTGPPFTNIGPFEEVSANTKPRKNRILVTQKRKKYRRSHFIQTFVKEKPRTRYFPTHVADGKKYPS